MSYNQIPNQQIDHAKQLREDNKIQPTHAPGQNPFAQPQQTNPFAPPQGQNPFAPQGQQPQANPFAPPQGQGQANPFAPPGQQPGGSPNPFAPPVQGQQPGFGSGFGTTQPPNQQYNQQQGQQRAIEDRLGDSLEAGVVSVWGFFKEISASFKQVDHEHLRNGANRTFYLSLSTAVATALFGFFKPDLWWITGGAVLTLPVSMVWSKVLTGFNKTQDNQQMHQAQQEPNPFASQEPNPFAQQEPEPYVEEPAEESKGYDFEDDDDMYEEEDDDEYLYEDEEDEDDEPLWKRNLTSFQQTNTGDIDTALQELDSIDPTMVSRQFLLDSFIKASQSITTDYYQRNEVDEDTMQFDETDAIIKDIFSVLGFTDDEDLPDLQNYTESLFVDELIVTRPQKPFKLENLDREYTQILRKGYNGQGGNIRMFVKSELIGRTLVIRIFKGVSPMVSMKDVVAANKEFYLDADNDMPLILSIDEEGKETKMDYLEEDGLIISGKKRSGKSYTLRSILHQMMIFNGPSKLNFYIGDVKGAASDYYKMRTPHVKRFESEPLEVLKMLEYIVKVEAKRREERFAEAGVIKIDDYHTAKPDAKDMPYLYVVIDEMVTLTTKLKELTTKETDYKSIYYGYLTALVTMLPAYGIRLIAVPHRITNDFLPKTASDNTTFKIAVRADEGLLKETLGLTQKQFGYDTPSKGDLAIKCTLVKPEPFYARSIVPSTTTDISDKIFDFQAKLWAKIEPESVQTSVMQVDEPTGVQRKTPVSNYVYQPSAPQQKPFQPTQQGLSLEDIETHQKNQLFADDDDDFI